MKVRAISPLIIESGLDGFYASSPLTTCRIRIARAVAEFLLAARGGVEAGDADPDVSSALPILTELGYLTGDEDPQVPPAPWRDWGSLAWAFHERIRDATFIRRGSAEEAAWQESLTREPPPPPTPLQQRARQRDALLLPRAGSRARADFWEVLEQRRTHRRFRDIPVETESFATLLHYTLGPLRFANARELGTLEMRASVSGGSRHETLGCVAVFNVADIPHGLYVYDGIRHGLVPLDKTVTREALDELTGSQGFCVGTGFSIITVADATKMSWKYRNPRAYRHLMNNVGAFAQVFSMTAHAVGAWRGDYGRRTRFRFRRPSRPGCAPRIRDLFSKLRLACSKPDGMPADYLAPQTPFRIEKG